MPAEAQQTEVMKQIAEAWEQAKVQFKELRAQVDRAERMARAKTEATFVGRERDQALRDFGEAVFQAVQRGQLSLPPTLLRALKGVQAVEDKVKQQAASIQDILQEGAEVAKRLKKPVVERNSPLAPRQKKR